MKQWRTRIRFFLILFLVMEASSDYSLLQSANTLGLIPGDRTVDWTRAGIPGGIPVYPIGVNVKDFGAKGDGVTDDVVAINAAIQACPDGKAVYMPDGIYVVSTAISINNKSVVLRGAGAGKTIVRGTINLSKGPGAYANSSPRIVSGAVKGSTELEIETYPDMDKTLRVGNYVLLLAEDPAIVNRLGYEANGRLWGQAQGQVLNITAVNGNRIQIDPPLYWTYGANANPTLYNRLLNYNPKNFTHHAGIESLTVDAQAARQAIYMSFAAYCWVRGVEIVDSYRDSILLSLCFRCEVRDNYVHDTNGSGNGGGYGINLENYSTENLIENNILNNMTSGISNNDGSAGNVVAYNFSGASKFRQNNYVQPGFTSHSCHPMMNLWEGNVSPIFYGDFVHGSASHSTLFRNRFYGFEAPEKDKQNFAVAIDAWNQYYNVIGNVLGTDGQSTVYEQPPNLSFANKAIYSLGFSGSGNPTNDNAVRTLLRHGNYDTVTKSVIWDPNISERVLPPSFYYSTRPPWWPAGFAWPSIGPDVPALATKIPAQKCFEDLNLAQGGSFDVDRCYGSNTAILNSNPTISSLPDKTIVQGTDTGALSFVIGDNETAPEYLRLEASSTNSNLVPLGRIHFSGNGSQRTVTVSAPAEQIGETTIIVKVYDEMWAVAKEEFKLTVVAKGAAPTELENPVPGESVFNPSRGEVLFLGEFMTAERDPILIYSRQGVLVKKVEDPHLQITWDGRNEKGDIVSAGVYHIKSPKKQKKIVVIK